ncbi:MAG: hypothetical protein HRU20_28700 [Pseudomonadales bacterium]|nr:hypothetical protein [Pseudomonadales bacterium]
MKMLFQSLFTLGLFFWVLLSVSACQKATVISHWDGHWERRVNVPKGQPGRCYDETLNIVKRQWVLTAVIHSTYECNYPFLELGFSGEIDEVLIKKHSDDNNVTLMIKDIHLISMVDITAKTRVVLSEQAVDSLTNRYVPEKWQSFNQSLVFNKNRSTMASSVFQPAASVAIPQLLDKNAMINYHR